MSGHIGWTQLGDAETDIGTPPSLRTDADANSLAKRAGPLPTAPCR